MNTCPSVLMMNLTKIANKVLGGQACQSCLRDGGAWVRGAGKLHSLVTWASQLLQQEDPHQSLPVSPMRLLSKLSATSTYSEGTPGATASLLLQTSQITLAQ